MEFFSVLLWVLAIWGVIFLKFSRKLNEGGCREPSAKRKQKRPRSLIGSSNLLLRKIGPDLSARIQPHLNLVWVNYCKFLSKFPKKNVLSVACLCFCKGKKETIQFVILHWEKALAFFVRFLFARANCGQQQTFFKYCRHILLLLAI